MNDEVLGYYCWNCQPAQAMVIQEAQRGVPFMGPHALSQGRRVRLGKSKDPQIASRVLDNCTGLWKPRTKP